MHIQNEKEMRVWAEQFAQTLKPGDVVSLVGDLGAGKTRLVQWICAFFNGKEPVTSPTFQLVNRYHTDIGYVNHLDLYRLEDPSEIEALDYEELFDPQDGITLIEWADHARDYLPSKLICVEIEKGDGEEREVHVR
ncbi:MAG: tRNA (adenosine(37)-N6)-threonylcarbamoyltransferase complex ATPase subunit type 1 TsaE [Peptoniphilaceae bacterium]|nr:tRNA (adenosine(37)-N6)-threonylcarbamoyltransferase complex ATPase subunit type 1 TsaE [Peptoniphilaceae bacterium]MDY5766436.1 tRNA (adenosine(37)-N6)-threonylcarbamoyltransferase complex ATPase subunit type 1 TsaE [Peptoniphilaceae bacterium]MDY5842008.1 tRNA (adenosine(37)-N6)-threonylcarbamoyltransferase complex ATPase subunit type 1 TsaE [Peptoniphilaceae bacterium]